MKEKITITVCTGTTCFLMGSSEILLVKDQMPEHLKNEVDVKGDVCLDYCQNSSSEKAPYVKVNGEYISDANVPKVIDYVEKIVKENL
ncbi:MAG: NAD(P)H-dependent oxidoreductase subunit E [Rhodothermaceae bacterium]